MRIALVGPHRPYRGGIAHFAASLQRELERRGHEVSALTFRRQYPNMFFPGQTEWEPDQGGGEEEAPRVLDSVGPWTWFSVARRLAREQIEAVVFSHWMPFFAPAYGSIARLLPGRVRKLAVVHNALPHERRFGDEVFSRYFFRACDGLLVLSASVEWDLLQLAPEVPVRRAPHPVYELFGDAPGRSDARHALALDERSPVGLFFGFVRRYKGLHVLMRALPSIVERLPSFRLIVAGEFYESRTTYLSLIDRPLRDHLILHDHYIPSEHVGRYFAAADLVIQPYTTATQSGVAQIAFHYGVPLIVTDVGGLAEVVPHEKAGLVVPPDDPAALAAAVVRFFGDNLAPALREGVRIQREQYTWGGVADALEDLL